MVQLIQEIALGVTNLDILQGTALKVVETAAKTTEEVIVVATEETDAPLPEADRLTEEVVKEVEIEVAVAKTVAQLSKRKVFVSSASKRVILKETVLI